MGKSHLSEEDIKLRYITPAIQNAGWDNKQIRMEYAFTAGRIICLLYTSPSPRDRTRSRMPSSA